MRSPGHNDLLRHIASTIPCSQVFRSLSVLSLHGHWLIDFNRRRLDLICRTGTFSSISSCSFPGLNDFLGPESGSCHGLFTSALIILRLISISLKSVNVRNSVLWRRFSKKKCFEHRMMARICVVVALRPNQVEGNWWTTSFNMTANSVRGIPMRNGKCDGEWRTTLRAIKWD